MPRVCPCGAPATVQNRYGDWNCYECADGLEQAEAKRLDPTGPCPHGKMETRQCMWCLAILTATSQAHIEKIKAAYEASKKPAANDSSYT